jgi:hypothetical protein
MDLDIKYQGGDLISRQIFELEMQPRKKFNPNITKVSKRKEEVRERDNKSLQKRHKTCLSAYQS